MVDHQDEKSEFSMMEQQLKWKLKDLFEEEWKKSGQKIYTSVRNLYESCMNMEAIEKNTISDTKEIIRRLGGWPVPKGYSWRRNHFEWGESK